MEIHRSASKHGDRMIAIHAMKLRRHFYDLLPREPLPPITTSKHRSPDVEAGR